MFAPVSGILSNLGTGSFLGRVGLTSLTCSTTGNSEAVSPVEVTALAALDHLLNSK